MRENLSLDFDINETGQMTKCLRQTDAEGVDVSRTNLMTRFIVNTQKNPDMNCGFTYSFQGNNTRKNEVLSVQQESSSLARIQNVSLENYNAYSNSSLGLPVCRIMCCITNKETSEWCGTLLGVFNQHFLSTLVERYKKFIENTAPSNQIKRGAKFIRENHTAFYFYPGNFQPNFMNITNEPCGDALEDALFSRFDVDADKLSNTSIKNRDGCAGINKCGRAYAFGFVSDNNRNYGIVKITEKPIRKLHSMLISSSLRGIFMSITSSQRTLFLLSNASTSLTESPEAIMPDFITATHFPLYFSTSLGCDDSHSSSCIFTTYDILEEENINALIYANLYGVGVTKVSGEVKLPRELEMLCISKVIIDQVLHILFDFLLRQPLRSDVKRGTGSDEPLALSREKHSFSESRRSFASSKICNKDWKGYFYICHIYHDSYYNEQSILSYFGMRQNPILDAPSNESDDDTMNKKIILSDGHNIIVWPGRFIHSSACALREAHLFKRRIMDIK